jgi:hypothetical protein
VHGNVKPADWSDDDRRVALAFLKPRSTLYSTHSGCQLWDGPFGAVKFRGVEYPSAQVLAFAAHHPNVLLRQNLSVQARCGDCRCVTPEDLQVTFNAFHGLRGPMFPALCASDLVRLQREAKQNPYIAMQYQKIIPEKVHDLYNAGIFGELERWLKPFGSSAAGVPAAAAQFAFPMEHEAHDEENFESMPALEALHESASSEAPMAGPSTAPEPVDDSTDDEMEMPPSETGAAASSDDNKKAPRRPTTALADWSAADFRDAQAYLNKNTASKKSAQGCQLWDFDRIKVARFRGVVYRSGQLLAFVAYNPDLPLKNGLWVEAKCRDPLCITSKCLRLVYRSPRGPKNAYFQTLTMEDIASLQQKAKNDSRIGMQHENISLDKLNSLHDAGDFAGIDRWLKPLA